MEKWGATGRISLCQAYPFDPWGVSPPPCSISEVRACSMQTPEPSNKRACITKHTTQDQSGYLVSGGEGHQGEERGEGWEPPVAISRFHRVAPLDLSMDLSMNGWLDGSISRSPGLDGKKGVR